MRIVKVVVTQPGHPLHGMALDRLEPSAGKLARSVLRGRGGGNVALLPSHVTMRITVTRNMAKSIRSNEWPTLAADADKLLERIKWYLWHGNVYRALQYIEYLTDDVYASDEDEAQAKLIKALEDFEHYISVNRPFIPNYGDRYRNGEHIATGFVESTVNQVISKRFVKSQSMRRTERGAHLLLQVRTKTLNKELRSTFERWYPDVAIAA